MKTLFLFIILGISTISNAQIVIIPDAQFKAYLVGNSQINTNMDTEIQISEASTFTGMIECNGENISDLTGIEAFTSLTFLRCHDNSLTFLDLSSNLSLTDLNCSLNTLTSLDLSNHTALTQLTCSYNDLTNLNINNCPNLLHINCRDNELSSLDLSDKPDLMNVTCRNNNITALDASSNVVLQAMLCDNNALLSLDVSNGYNSVLPGQNFDASNNPGLTCIQVDDENYSNSNWLSIDAQSYFSVDCSSVGLEELTTNERELLFITDVFGRLKTFESNVLLIYVYSDGTMERVFKTDL